jgi:hypothetical protein
MRVDRLGRRNCTHGYRLAALAVAAYDEADDPGADRESEGDQDDQSLSSDSGDVELASDGRVYAYVTRCFNGGRSGVQRGAS